jgi:ATP-dependent Lon protease
MPLVIGRPASLRALDRALMGENRAFLAAQRDQSVDDPSPGDVESVGSICKIVQRSKQRRGFICTIVQTLKRSDNPVRVLVNGLVRGSVLEFKKSQGFLEVVVKPVPREWEPSSGELDAERVSRVRALFDRCVKRTRNPRWDEVLVALARFDDPGKRRSTDSTESERRQPRI